MDCVGLRESWGELCGGGSGGGLRGGLGGRGGGQWEEEAWLPDLGWLSFAHHVPRSGLELSSWVDD